VDLEDMLVKKINSWTGEKKNYDFINNPVYIEEYQRLAGLLQEAIQSTKDETKSFWQRDAATPVTAKVIFDQFMDTKWFKLEQYVEGSNSVSPNHSEKKKKDGRLCLGINKLSSCIIFAM
jgi:hypothetical protein